MGETWTRDSQVALGVPERAGCIEPNAARALNLAALCASTDETRPVLTSVCWEGDEDVTRAIGTDCYRLAIIEVPRTRVGVKPAAGRSWGLASEAVRQAYRKQVWRQGELGVELLRIAPNVWLQDAGGDSWSAHIDRMEAHYPRWRACIPGPARSWICPVKLGELARLIRRMGRAYRQHSKWGPRVILLPDKGRLTVWPSLDLRDATWPPEWVGGSLDTYGQEVTIDMPMAVNARLLAEPLWRAAEWLGDDALVAVSAGDGTPEAHLLPVTFSVVPMPQCARLELIVMPMQMYEGWPEPHDPQREMRVTEIMRRGRGRSPAPPNGTATADGGGNDSGPQARPPVWAPGAQRQRPNDGGMT